MNFQEAVKYMRETRNSVCSFGREYRIIQSNEVGFGPKLQHKICRNIFGREFTWMDTPICDLFILEQMLGYAYEPVIMYMSFIEVVGLIKANPKLTFTRKYYTESYQDDYGNERGEYNNYLIFSDDVDGGITLYNDTFGAYLHLMPDDILATDWYVTEVKK